MLRSISSYARELRPALGAGIFAPARSRLWWLPVHAMVIASGILLLARHALPWPLIPAISLLIGLSFSGLTFLGHETLHGAIVRGRHLRRLVGWLGFLPFAISPRLWIAWHNRVHHGNTNRVDIDPDAYPTLEAYRQSRAVRIATDAAAPGRSRLRGALSLLVGFSVQSTHMLLSARKRGFFSTKEHALALGETLLGVLLWLGLAFWIGLGLFVFAFVLPLLVANVVVMAHILTNHSLSPTTATNDPLANSLSVTVPRWAEWLTLGFGYHVEHHLFPAMSARHARKVRDLLRARFPLRYHSLPLLRALLLLHRTARVYKTPTTLIDPPSGRQWPTLGAQALE